ncbi:MAG: hypothetical protein PHG85_01280 [Candidatus Altiarchaeota archaeon]|nr:hypothetical protein [Candidatus Altiarchaeota archaeon]
MNKLIKSFATPLTRVTSSLIGLIWGELRKRLLPSCKDFLLSGVLTIIFALACQSTILGLALFYIIALLIIYLIPRLAYIIRAYMKYRQAKKTIGGIAGSVGKLADMLKK